MAALREAAAPLIRPGSVMQVEPRLAVPTVLWARGDLAAAPERWRTNPALRPPEAASRAALAAYKSLYRLDDDDVASAVVANLDDRGDGPVLVKYRAERHGIEIFGEELNVVMTRQLETVALTGYLTSAATPPTRPGALDFQLSPDVGAITALNHMASTRLDPSRLAVSASRDGYDYFDLASDAGVALEAPVRTKPVYFHTAPGLESAYYVELVARTGPPAPGVFALDGGTVATTEAYAYVVSAATGQLLFRANLIADATPTAPPEPAALPPGGFTYRVWADPVTGIPRDTPAGNTAHPKVVAVPDGAQAQPVAPSDVTLANFPFSRNDPWVAPTAIQTAGNNAFAYVDLFSPDHFGPAADPADPATGDFTAHITAPGQFLHTNIPDGNGARSEGRQGAIQQLFYTVNFLHDWYYDAGLDEASRNAQIDNFGRGGLEHDSILAEAQDFSGINNANMLTPADGFAPVMQMFPFLPPANRFEVLSPAAVVGPTTIGVFMSGDQTFDVTGDLALASFDAPPGCTLSNADALAGKLAVFDIDSTASGCDLVTRLRQLGLTAAVAQVGLWPATGPFNPTGNPDVFGVSLARLAELVGPIAIITPRAGVPIQARLAGGQTVRARVVRAPDRDAALDNQIVAHEFFHYVSNRLIGNGSGLGFNQARGLGEGWGDFSAMLLTVREDDALVPSNAEFNGVYALATWATSGVPFSGAQNQGYYFGVRRYPYSTDMTRNPLTFKHVSNGVALPVGPPVAFGADGTNNAESHSTGEVWAEMLWEGYAGLLRDTLADTPRLTFQQAQARMKRYLVGGLKVTPTQPTLTEARDAILAVALANDLADFVVLRTAFAKRGAGPHAVAPGRLSGINAGVIEDFTVGPDLVFDVALDDSAGSCDGDGILDRGELGRLTVTVRNTGTTVLRATHAAVTPAPGFEVAFPDGATLAFPVLTPGAVASASVRVAYAQSVTGIQSLRLQVEVSDPKLATQIRDVAFRANADELSVAAATETFEGTQPLASVIMLAPTAMTPVVLWQPLEVSATDHAVHLDDPGEIEDFSLLFPAMTVDATGQASIELDHSWSFDSRPAGNVDGAVVELQVDTAPFIDVGGPAYNGVLLAQTSNRLQGRPAFVGNSNGTVHTKLPLTVPAGHKVRLRLRFGSDAAVGAPGWTIDNVRFNGFVETPFASVIAEPTVCTNAQ